MLSWVKIRDCHDNFFTPMRLLFALLVVIGHAFVVSYGAPKFEPTVLFSYTPSYLAVNLFFIASGFLVTKSMLYRNDLTEYGSARFLRIFPALFVHVLFVMLIIGPLVTSTPLKEYLKDPAFFTQPFQVLSFYETQMFLPGAFENNHEQIGSASLWTLRYEVLAYIGTAMLFVLGALRSRFMIAIPFILLAIAWPTTHALGLFEALPATIQAILRFGLCYSLGAAIYAYRDKLSFHIGIVPIMGLAIAVFHGTVLFEVLLALWLGYITFWMAYVKVPALNSLKKLDDTSYGIYIYHWVILQTIAHFTTDFSPWALLALTLPITIALAYMSWIWIEKPALKKKAGLAQAIKARFSRKPSTETTLPAE